MCVRVCVCVPKLCRRKQENLTRGETTTLAKSYHVFVGDPPSSSKQRKVAEFDDRTDVSGGCCCYNIITGINFPMVSGNQ